MRHSWFRMKWNEVIGQDSVKDRLKGLVSSGRVPHALMLCGDTGNGTLALAIAMASTLLCQGRLNTGGGGMFAEEEPTEPLPEPCGHCPQCAMLRQLHHPDLHFSFPTVKSPKMSSDHKPVSDDYMTEWCNLISEMGPYISLDDWMDVMGASNKQAIITAAESDALPRKIALKSSQGGYKVAIIWLAERMNEESANKILKTLEEPTDKTVFILCVERPERLLETIRSRVQRIDVPKIDTESLTRALMQRRGLDEDVARRLARATDGNWNKAVEQLLPDSEQKMFLHLFKMIMRYVYTKDLRGMKQWSDSIGDSKFGREKQKRLLEYFMRMVREAFVSNFHNPELSYMTAEEEQFVANFGRFIHEGNVIEITHLLELALRDISQNTNQKIVLFDTALQLTVLIRRPAP